MTIRDAGRPPALPFTRADIEQTVPARFEQVVDRFADCVALVGNGERLTYRELSARADDIAWAILDGAAPGAGCVAFLVDHSPAMVTCTLAVLKAGKILLAIHPGMPAAAQRNIVRDAAPELILTTAAQRSRAREIAADVSCRLLILDEITPRSTSGSPPLATGPDDLSTVYYTSGTTGQPKGVMKSHRTVLHRMWLLGQHDAIVPDDRQSLLTYCSFAASEADLFGALLYGATLCLFDVASRGLEAFADWIDAERITVLHPPALLFRRFLSTLEGGNLFPSVRLVALAGDVVLPADIEKWKRHFSKTCALTHRFSTTETALLAVERVEHDAPHSPDFVPAGRPVADKRLVLIDGEGRPVESGATGELVVKSPYIAQGYWRRPEETASAFRPDPDQPGARIYRTGDLGRFLEDGRFLFAGRRDHQVKIRGYRVETREIEAALLQLDIVREAAVLVRREKDEPELIAFVVLHPNSTLDDQALRDRLRDLLPEWKLPGIFRQIASLPTTLTGKIDRQQLAAVVGEQRAVESRTAAIGASVEDELAEFWKISLKRHAVGQDDRFSDLGGDSLTAMVVLSRIERRFGVRIAPDEFARHGTIRSLAERIRRSPPPVSAFESVIVTPELGQRWMSLVPLQPQGTRPPLFFIHGKGGEVHEFAALAEQLGPDQPVYGLRAAGLDDDGAKPASVEEMAALYVREIRALQPKGPYYLGGYSIGGMIAFETARQLIQVEQEVGLLALLDTWATNLPWRIFFRSKGTYLLRRLKYHTERIMTGKVSDPWNYARDRFDVLCGYFSSNRRYRLHTTIARRVAAAFARRAEGKDYYLTLAQYYRPLPLKVPVVLFMAEDQKNDAVAWRYLAPSHLEVQPVRGRHSTLLHRESAADLAAIFRWHLTAAQART